MARELRHIHWSRSAEVEFPVMRMWEGIYITFAPIQPEITFTNTVRSHVSILRKCELIVAIIIIQQ